MNKKIFLSLICFIGFIFFINTNNSFADSGFLTDYIESTDYHIKAYFSVYDEKVYKEFNKIRIPRELSNYDYIILFPGQNPMYFSTYNNEDYVYNYEILASNTPFNLQELPVDSYGDKILRIINTSGFRRYIFHKQYNDSDYKFFYEDISLYYPDNSFLLNLPSSYDCSSYKNYYNSNKLVRADLSVDFIKDLFITNYPVLITGTEEGFSQAPQPTQEEEQNTTSTSIPISSMDFSMVMAEILGLLPILLAILISYLSLRKAISLLFQVLRKSLKML